MVNVRCRCDWGVDRHDEQTHCGRQRRAMRDWRGVRVRRRDGVGGRIVDVGTFGWSLRGEARDASQAPRSFLFGMK